MKDNQLLAKYRIEIFSRNNFEELHDSLLKLPSKKQQAIQMRFFEGLAIDQISQVLGMTWEQADKLIENALGDLRTMLEVKLEYAHMIQAA